MSNPVTGDATSAHSRRKEKARQESGEQENIQEIFCNGAAKRYDCV